MFALLAVRLNVPGPVAAEKDAVQAGVKPGTVSLTDMTDAGLGLQQSKTFPNGNSDGDRGKQNRSESVE